MNLSWVVFPELYEIAINKQALTNYTDSHNDAIHYLFSCALHDFELETIQNFFNNPYACVFWQWFG